MGNFVDKPLHALIGDSPPMQFILLSALLFLTPNFRGIVKRNWSDNLPWNQPSLGVGQLLLFVLFFDENTQDPCVPVKPAPTT